MWVSGECKVVVFFFLFFVFCVFLGFFFVGVNVRWALNVRWVLFRLSCTDTGGCVFLLRDGVGGIDHMVGGNIE
jgi:uncharacterized membrane protein